MIDRSAVEVVPPPANIEPVRGSEPVRGEAWRGALRGAATSQAATTPTPPVDEHATTGHPVSDSVLAGVAPARLSDADSGSAEDSPLSAEETLLVTPPPRGSVPPTIERILPERHPDAEDRSPDDVVPLPIVTPIADAATKSSTGELVGIDSPGPESADDAVGTRTKAAEPTATQGGRAAVPPHAAAGTDAPQNIDVVDAPPQPPAVAPLPTNAEAIPERQPGTTVSVADDLPDRVAPPLPIVDTVAVATSVPANTQRSAVGVGQGVPAAETGPELETLPSERPWKDKPGGVAATSRGARGTQGPVRTSADAEPGSPTFPPSSHAGPMHNTTAEPAAAVPGGAPSRVGVEPLSSDRAPSTPTLERPGGVEPSAEVSSRDHAGNPNDRFPDPFLARGTASQATEGHVTPQQQLWMVHRVARAIQSAQVGGGVIRLRLHPAELGALNLELSIERGTLRARLETESSLTRQIILDQLPQLRARLEEMGVRIEQFEVDVAGRDAADAHGRPDDREPPPRLPHSTVDGRGTNVAAGQADNRSGRAHRPIAGRIDVMI